jgi:hypothetical protein
LVYVRHHFYNNGGVLAADLSIYNSLNTLVHSWTLSAPIDLIGGVGGNQYGWFDLNEFNTLAFDNAQLRTLDANVPEPSTLAIVGVTLLSLLGLGLTRRRSDA